MQKGRTGRFTIWMEYSSRAPWCDLLVQKNFCHDGSWYWKYDIPQSMRTIAKVTIILKEQATLSTESN